MKVEQKWIAPTIYELRSYGLSLLAFLAHLSIHRANGILEPSYSILPDTVDPSETHKTCRHLLLARWMAPEESSKLKLWGSDNVLSLVQGYPARPLGFFLDSRYHEKVRLHYRFLFQLWSYTERGSRALDHICLQKAGSESRGIRFRLQEHMLCKHHLNSILILPPALKDRPQEIFHT